MKNRDFIYDMKGKKKNCAVQSLFFKIPNGKFERGKGEYMHLYNIIKVSIL